MSQPGETHTHVDARRDLGRRPGGQPTPRLHIDDAPLENLQLSPVIRYARPSPSSRDLSLTLPPIIPSPASPAAPPSPTSPSRSRGFHPPTKSQSGPAPASKRGLYETQKLLAHLLGRLEVREVAPDLLERAAVGAREISGRSKNKGKGRVRKLGQVVVSAAQSGLHIGQNGAGPSTKLGVGSDDFEDMMALQEGDWDTEATYDLVEQTRGLLVLADRQNLNLFASSVGASPSVKAIPVRGKRKAGRFSAITSPTSPSKPRMGQDEVPLLHAEQASAISGPSLLKRILAVLRSLVLVDCLHRTPLFRPLCPPNALQAACLDIAGYLYHKCGIDTKLEVVDTIVDGFHGMGEGMVERVCEWLEGRLGELLGRLARERGGSSRESSDWNDPFAAPVASQPSVPIFAFSTEPPTKPPSSTSPGWMRFSPATPSFPFIPTPNSIVGLLSTHSTSNDNPTTSLHIASLVTRIFAVITSTVDMTSAKLTTIHRVHRLLSLVLTVKPDAAINLLEIVALAPPSARRTAMEILNTFYPSAMGHNVIARRLASTTYLAQRTKWETGQERVFGEDATGDHHFVTWRVSSRETPGSIVTPCATCHKEMHGFCLRCTLCRDVCHLHCFQPIEQAFKYEIVTLSAQESVPQTAYVKFSDCMARLNEQVIAGQSVRGHPRSTRRRVGGHDLHLVNLFNLTLCDDCHEPLWGSTSQGYACMNGCQRFYHTKCTDRMAHGEPLPCKYGREVVIDEISAQGRNPFVISFSALQASFDREIGFTCLSEDELAKHSYDEVAVLHGALWTQYQIFKNGMSSGSIRITTEDLEQRNSDPLELHEVLTCYEVYLQAHDMGASNAAMDFAHVSGSEQLLGQGYLFSDRYLTYSTALLRAPSSGSFTASRSEGLRTAQGFQEAQDSYGSGTGSGAYEMLDLSALRRGLASDFNIHGERVAALFLDQLRSTGLCTYTDQKITADDVTAGNKLCYFILPLLMDSSPTVELLILAIETSLDDLDLTMNEQAFQLLISRAWPSLLCSPCALERLGHAVVSWVMAQDDSLVRIVKLYASKHRRLPGVRAATGKGTSSVPVYQESRDQLLKRYAQPWLAALHDQDAGTYAQIVYEQCQAPVGMTDSDVSSDEAAWRIAGVALERMTVAMDADVIFSVKMDLLTAWLEDLGDLADKDVIYKSLPRLLRNDDARSPKSAADLDIWTLCQETSTESSEGLDRVCRWMRVLAFSGVEIPWSTLTDLIHSPTSIPSSLEARLDLVIAVNANGEPIDPDRFAKLCCQMFVNHADHSASRDAASQPTPLKLELCRQNMLGILRAYGVTLDDISTTSLQKKEEKAKQPASFSKRRRATSYRTLLELDEPMVLAAASIMARRLYPTEMLLDFLWLLFTKSAYAANVDSFLHRMCPDLYPVIWPLFDLSIDRRRRLRVFLRLLAVNAAPMVLIVEEQFRMGNQSDVRERLLVFVLELADDSITFENTGWRPAAVGLIFLFLETLTDPSNVTPDNLIVLRALLPTHLRSLSLCFEEQLLQSSDDRRLLLLCRLQRLRIALPSWPVLSWPVIESLLTEQVVAVTQLPAVRSSQRISALQDAQAVRASLLAIGLDKLSSSIPIPWISTQRFQQHVASAGALPWTVPSGRFTSLVLPALRGVLDSPNRLVVGATNSKKTILVGSLFVAVVIDFHRELDKHDFLTQRCILDILMVTFFKQDVRPVELAAVSALQGLAEFAAADGSVENRLLAIQILQTAVSRVGTEGLSRAVPAVFCTVASILVKETENDGDSAAIEQTRLFLRSIIKMFVVVLATGQSVSDLNDSFGRSGLFVQLFRHDASRGTSADAKTSLGRALQLLASSEAPPSNGTPKFALMDLVFGDLSDVLKRGRQTVEQVLESFSRFAACLHTEVSNDAAASFGIFIVRVRKHVAEWNASEFDPNPLLRACEAILDLVPSLASTTLLQQTSTLLHLCLSRFEVGRSTTTDLLRMSKRIAIRESTEDTIRTVLFELAGSAVHGLAVTPTSLSTLLHFLTTQAFPKRTSISATAQAQQARVLSESAAGCLAVLLRVHPSISGATDTDVGMTIALQAATILLDAEVASPGQTSHTLVSIMSEAAQVQLGVFVNILLASIHIHLGQARQRIISLYPLLARAMSLSLRGSADFLTVQDAAGDGAELLSLVFVAIRLAILAAHDPPSDVSERGFGDDAVEALWARVWPDWHRLLTLSFNPGSVNEPLRAVSRSVFLDLVIVLGNLHSPILSDHAGSLRHALRLLADHQDATGNQAIAKLVKAQQALDRAGHETGTVDIVKAIRGDLVATERLRALKGSA